MELIETPPRRILVVTPHPDDAEGGCGGTMGKWAQEDGTQIVVVLCTNGDKGTSNREMSPEELALTREREQQEASDLLGVKEVVFLSHPDGGLEDKPLFRSQIVREIRRHKPETIFCIDPYRNSSHTHRDHRMSGQVALDAAFTYAWSYLHFPEQITLEGLEPHRVTEALMWGSETPDVFVDIAGYLEMKVNSLSKHASQMSGRMQDREERMRRWASRTAESTGIPFAETFRRQRLDIGSMAWQYLSA